MNRSETKAAYRRDSVAFKGVLCLLVGLLWAGLPASAQMSAAEHASHHPGAAPAAPAAKTSPGMGTQPAPTGGMGGMMSGMGGSPAAPAPMSGMGASPAAPAPASPNASGMGDKLGKGGGMGGAGMGGAGGMGGMMKGMMGGAQQQELYPSLMALPTTTSEQRLQLQQQAEGRANTGAALLQQGTVRMANPAANDIEMQEGAADARAGLQELESGQAARRALVEGRPPRAVALQWFQSEMNLASPLQRDELNAQHGVTPFHLFTMILLVLFALAMVAMYFFKMRRAATLFGRLDSDSGSSPGASPPLAGTPGPSTPGASPEGKKPPTEAKAPPPPAPTPPVSPPPPAEKSPTPGSPPGASPSPAAPAAPPTSPAAPGGDTAKIAGQTDALWQARGRPLGFPETGGLRTGEEPANPPVTANWKGQLRVGSIVTETPNVKTFRLLPSSNDRFLPFDFLPGQFLNVAFAIGGARMNRSYSISSSPTEREHVDLTIRREPRGAVSRHIDDILKVGDLIETGGPVGKFTFNGTEADSIVLISGGVGITPMMSISRYLTELSWPGDIFFVYTCRAPADFIFKDEIAALQSRNPHLHVAVTLSNPEGTDWKGARGRISKEWLTQVVPDLASRRTHLCGPPGMMDAVKAIFTELGIPPDHLKTEAFGAVKPAPAAPGAAKPTGVATGPLVTFSKNNKSSKIREDLQTGDSPPKQSILELSEELSIGIEFSCRVGTCGVCKTKMTSGEVDQEVQDALDDDDKAKGIILACQAKPKNDVTVEA